MSILPASWQPYLHIATDDLTTAKRGRLLYFYLLVITAVLTLRWLIRVGVAFTQQQTDLYLPLLLFPFLVAAYTGAVYWLVRQARLTFASHLLLIVPLVLDWLVLLLAPLELWLHPLFGLLILLIAISLLPPKQSWPYFLVSVVMAFYLEWLNLPGLYYLLTAVGLAAVATAVRYQQTIAYRDLRQATDQLSQLNQTLQQKIDTQTADLRRRNEQLELSLEVLRTSASTLNLEELLYNTANHIQKEFNFYHVSIFLLDDTARHVVIREATGQVGKQLKTEAFALPIGSQSIVGQATLRRQPQLATDTSEDPFFQRHPLLPQTRSELALPLIARGYLVGALDVQSSDIAAFGETDITNLQLLAEQLAQNIDNATLFAQLQNRAQQLAELQTITSLMTVQSDVLSALNVLAQRARQLVKADGASVFLWRKELQKLELVLNLGIGDKISVGHLLEAGEGLTGLSFSEGETYVIDDYQTWPNRLEVFAEVDFQAVMTVSLKERDTPMGVLVLIRRIGMPTFSLEDVQIAEVLAAQVGTIITNQQLFEELHTLVQRERVLNKITAGVRQSLNPETIVEAAAQELGEALHDKRVRVQLYPAAQRTSRTPVSPES
jgi:GAF domain-containing protein